jgi:beta-glucanase (GH16 family)
MPRRRLLSRLGAFSLVVTAIAVPLVSRVGVAAAATPQPVGSAGGANLVFSDEFNGPSLDTSKWRTCSWWASTTCSIETNAEQELYTPNNVSVSNGVLDLQARQESAVGWNGKTYNYTSGMISSGGLYGSSAPGFSYTYGYAEARVKVPAGQGLWPAFWQLPADYSWPPEIDAMEILGNQPSTTYMHYHYLDAAGNTQGPGASWTGPDFSAGWHTFGVDWEPTAITYYVDGVARWSFTDAANITNKPQYLVLNLAVGGNWPGAPNASTPFPSDFLVDYVRVWDQFGTPASTTTTTAPAPTTTTTVAPPAYSATVVADKPVSYWRLGESAGTTAADSVGGHGGTYRNGVTLGAPSLVATDASNTAASFNGVNNYVTVPSSAALSPTGAVTVEAWLNPSAKPAAGSFASVVTKAESYSIQFNGPQLEFTTIRGTTRRRVQAPASAVVPGQTYHVVGTYDGTTQRLYVNGVLVASGAFSGAINANTHPVTLGSWDGASEYVSATLDDVSVYGKVLTSTQVANHYAAGHG